MHEGIGVYLGGSLCRVFLANRILHNSSGMVRGGADAGLRYTNTLHQTKARNKNATGETVGNGLVYQLG